MIKFVICDFTHSDNSSAHLRIKEITNTKFPLVSDSLKTFGSSFVFVSSGKESRAVFFSNYPDFASFFLLPLYCLSWSIFLSTFNPQDPLHEMHPFMCLVIYESLFKIVDFFCKISKLLLLSFFNILSNSLICIYLTLPNRPHGDIHIKYYLDSYNSDISTRIKNSSRIPNFVYLNFP